MTKKQRESTAKYLYDISKGIALLAIIGNLLKDKWDIPTLIFGSLAALFTFIVAFILEGSINHEWYGYIFYDTFYYRFHRSYLYLLHPEAFKETVLITLTIK